MEYKIDPSLTLEEQAISHLEAMQRTAQLCSGGDLPRKDYGDIATAQLDHLEVLINGMEDPVVKMLVEPYLTRGRKMINDIIAHEQQSK